MTHTFAAAPRETLSYFAEQQIYAGWQPVWCLARQSGAFTPMPGTTGGSSPFGSVRPQPDGWHRLAFRPPEDVVILDVDHYDDKRGMDTIDLAQQQLGDLPDTWKVTSRGFENPSGRYLYRKPADLDFTDSALAVFGTDGVTNVEIVRTAHRFSWAPGDINPKNGQVVMCYDPDGEPGQLPHVSLLPELPEAWVKFLRNPPIPQYACDYTRPCDGPEWWLSQADDSIGTRTELAGFAMSLLESRLSLVDAMEQLRRVSVALDPARPWADSDLLPLLDQNTQRKVSETLARQDAAYEFVKEQAHATDEQLDAVADRAKAEYERQQAFDRAVALREQNLVQFAVDQSPGIPICFDPDDPDYISEEDREVTPENMVAMVKGLPQYKQELHRMMARKVAEKEMRNLLRKQWAGFQDITEQPEIAEPERLVVVGKDQKSSAVIARKTVSVFSGHRASGKTWVAAKFAHQEIRAGRHVIWIDFERQPALLLEKLKTCGLVNEDLIRSNLHYADELPPDLAYYAAQYPDCLVVIDAWRGLQQEVAPSTSANDGDAVEQVYAEVLNPAVGVGATIIILDHLAKTGVGGTFGSERKESAADYVFKVDQVKAFSRKEEGYSTIRVTKDRYGHHTADSVAAYLWVPAGESGESIKDYPQHPELRNWSPQADEVPTPEQVLNGEEPAPKAAKSSSPRSNSDIKKRKQRVVLGILGQDPLQYHLRALARECMNQEPDLFTGTEDGIVSFLRGMKRENLILEDGGGKFEVRQAATKVDKATGEVIDLSLPEDSDEES